jgi:L-ascorbate oxidase
MPLPTEEQWPPMPWFLQDIDSFEDSRTVPFRLQGRAATATDAFYIDGVQYCPTCAQYTTTRTEAEEWTVVNTYDPNPKAAAPQHPFHIHINPFQLRSKEHWVLIDDCDTNDPMCTQTANQGKCLTEPKLCTTTYDPPIWMDTVALPPAITLKDGTTVKDGQVVFRQKYEDFTGEYVLHCHFLGHEDRGMMVNVQTVCEGKPEDLFGKTVPASPDDCAVTSDAALRCSGPCELPAGH